MSKSWIDVSVPLHSGMVHWPTDPPVHIERLADMDKGGVCNVSKIQMCAHAGTHMDGLNHFIQDGASLDTVPFEAVIGPCRVIQIQEQDSVKPAELKRHNFRKGERILLKTRNSKRPWWEQDFDTKFTHISKEAAQHLVECGIRLPLRGRLSARRRGVSPGPSRRGSLDHRGTEPHPGETGQIRLDLSAGENPEQRRRAGPGCPQTKVEETQGLFKNRFRFYLFLVQRRPDASIDPCAFSSSAAVMWVWRSARNW